jgi:hypothetical protein
MGESQTEEAEMTASEKQKPRRTTETQRGRKRAGTWAKGANATRESWSMYSERKERRR